MSELKNHWNRIFVNKEDSQLGWYESDPTQTTKFTDLIPHKPKETTLFLPGAGTSTLVEILNEKKYKKLILNDISNEALTKLKSRLPDDGNIVWLDHDMSKPVEIELPPIDIWIDRAVLHFLLEESDIEGYFNNLKKLLNRGGHVLLAEFSILGAPKCAGLDLHRYSVKEMCERLGSEFKLIKQEDYTYKSPVVGERPYIYALFKRVG